jgi:hypothetical protein
MEFRAYQHIEKYGTSEVEGIELGRCFIFSKIDGTNSSLWLDSGELKAGSRTRELTLEKDNADFYQWALKQENLIRFLKDHPDHRLYGEWLVPHSLKTYKDDAWRRFYVFDVTQETEGSYRYLSYDEYKPLMEEYNIDYIPPISIITNPSYEKLIHQLESSSFMIQDGKGNGEGIVIKRYDYVNKYGRTTWAKIVSTEFKEKHSKTMGPPEMKGKSMVEQEIVDKHLTQHMCEKVYAKIDTEVGWTSKCIPRLLNTVYYDLVREEAWNFVKDHRNPVINFKTLQSITFAKVKEYLPNLF